MLHLQQRKICNFIMHKMYVFLKIYLYLGSVWVFESYIFFMRVSSLLINV